MSNDSIDCIIFDRDGTILDFSEMFYQFILQLYRTEKLVAPDRQTISSLEFWLDITRHNLTIGQIVVKNHVDDVPRKYMEFARAYPGVPESLIRLRGAGLRMAVVSGWVGTEPTKTWLDTIGLAATFQCVLTADELQQNRWDYLHSEYLNVKCALLETALVKLGASASNTWVVGDSPEDIAAGSILGAKTIAVLTGNGQRLSSQIADLKPHLIVDSAAEIHRIFGNGDATR